MTSRTLQKRKERISYNLRKNNKGYLRLCVRISNMAIYAQLIDDLKGHTIASSSSIDKENKPLSKTSRAAANIACAQMVGKILATKAMKCDEVKKAERKIVFDRGGKKYHGKVKALADSARAAGLKF